MLGDAAVAMAAVWFQLALAGAGAAEGTGGWLAQAASKTANKSAAGFTGRVPL